MIPDLIGVPPYLQVPIRGLGNNDAKDVRYSRVVYQVRNLGAPHETDSLLPPDIIAGEISEALEVALEQFKTIAAELS